MSKHTCSLSLFKGLFPDSASAWVITALRHDPLIWNCLQDIEFATRAVEFIGNDPKNWSPASLALLSLGLPGRPDNYHHTPLSSLDKDLRKQVSKNFEDLTQGISLYEKSSTETDPSPQWYIQHAVPQAGLTALALRERLRLMGSWSGFQDDLEGLPNFSVSTWFTPVAILFGLLPDPIALLLELTGKDSTYAMNILAIHSILANPLSPADRKSMLMQIFEPAMPVTQRTLLDILALKQPDLYQDIALWLVDRPITQLDHLLDLPGLDQLSELVRLTHQAEIFRKAGLYGESLRLIDNSLKITSNLLTEYTSRWYVTADQASDGNNPEFLSKNVDTLTGWVLAEPSIESYSELNEISPADITRIKMAIRSGNKTLIEAFLSRLTQEQGRNSLIPEDIQFAIIRYLIHSGETQKAHEFASELSSRLFFDEQNMENPTWLDTFYGVFSLTKINTLENLVEIFYDLRSLHNVIEHTYKILKERPNDLKHLSLLGRTLQQSGLIVEALHVFELASLLTPNDLDILRIYARCLDANKDFEAAYLAWSQVLEKSAEAESEGFIKTDDILSVAASAILASHPDIAIELCQKILSVDVSNWRAHTLLGKANTILERSEEGLASLQVATQLAPEQPEPWLETARIYQALGQPQEAINILQAAIQAIPDAVEIQLDLGKAYLAENALTSAVVHLRNAYEATKDTSSHIANLKHRQNFLESAENLGQALRRLGHIQESCQILERAVREIQGQPTLSEKSLLYSYAQSMLASGDVEEAIPILETVLSLDPGSIQPYLDYGRALLATGIKSREAVDALTVVYKANPNDPETLAMLADALAMDNQHDRAMQSYLEVMDTNLSKDEVWQERLNLGLGRTALALNQVETAIAALQEAANLNPRNPVIQRWLADACWSADLTEDGWTAASKALQLDSKNLSILDWFADHTLGLFQNKNKTVPQEKEFFHRTDANQEHRSLNLKPEAITAEALTAFQQAYSCIDDKPALLTKMGQLQAVSGKHNSAIETLCKVIDHPNSTSVDLQQASRVLINVKDYRDSILALEKALNRLEYDPKAKNLLQKDLVRAHLANNDTHKANLILCEAIAESPSDISLYLTLSLLRLSEGELPKALQVLTDGVEATTQENHLAELHFILAWILMDQGNFEFALEHAFTSLNLIKKLENKRTQILDEYDVLSLTVRLARMVLEPEKVKVYLSGLPKQFEFNDAHLQNYANVVDCYASTAEIALEEEDILWSRSAMGNATILFSQDPHRINADHIRTLALQCQLQLSQQNEEAALEYFRMCRQAFDLVNSADGKSARYDSIYPTWVFPIHKTLSWHCLTVELWDFISIINAALAVHQFEYAITLSNDMVSRWKNVPLAHLTYAKVLCQAAEANNIYEDLKVTSHSTDIGTILQEPFQVFSQTISTALQTLHNNNRLLSHPHEPSPSQKPDSTSYLRWLCRGNAAFQKEPGSLETCKWDEFPGYSKDVAARLAWFRRWTALQPDPKAVDNLIRRELNYAEPFKHNPDVLIQIALLTEINNPEEALLLCHELTIEFSDVIQNPRQAIHHALLALISYRQQEFEIANQAIQTALEAWPEEPYWHLLAGKIVSERQASLSEEEYQSIFDHIEIAINNDPYIFEAYELLGALLLGGQVIQSFVGQRGIAILENAAKTNPEQPTILLTLAKSYLVSPKLSDQKLAAQHAKQLIALNTATSSQIHEAMVLLAEIALQKKDAQEAFKLAGEVRADDPENEQAILIQIQSLEILGQNTQALAELDNIIGIVNKSKKLGLIYAELIGKCQSKENELTYLENLARKYPEDLDVLWALAQSLTERGKTDQAVRAAQNAIQKTPNNGEQKYLSGLHHLLGNLLAQLGQLDQAIHHLGQSIEYQADNAEPYLALGEVYQRQRLHLKARKVFEQAVRVAPRDPRPYIQVALSMKEGKDYQNAEVMLRKAVELSPHDVNIRKQLAAVVAINLVNNPNPIQTHSIH